MEVVVERSNSTGWLIINRPEVLNAFSPETWQQFEAGVCSLGEDSRIKCMVIIGSGQKSFSVGADLKVRSRGVRTVARPALSALEKLWRIEKPVVAAVNGYALGGGLEIALRCDLIVASENAVFGLPEAYRGLIADSGGLALLPGRIGVSRASELALTGRHLTAPEVTCH